MLDDAAPLRLADREGSTRRTRDRGLAMRSFSIVRARNGGAPADIEVGHVMSG
jgi:hypothetical protein